MIQTFGNHQMQGDNIAKVEAAAAAQLNEAYFRVQVVSQKWEPLTYVNELLSQDEVQIPQNSKTQQQQHHQSAASIVSVPHTGFSKALSSQGAETRIIEEPQVHIVSPTASIHSIHSLQDGDLVTLAAIVLHTRCSECRAYETSYKSSFHSSRIPPIPIWDYLRRIARYSDCSPECFIMSIMMLDRYVVDTGIPLTFTNIHRLTITAVMITAKVRDDVHYPNSYFASIGGVSNKEINMLEIEMLMKISWWTWAEPAVYCSYLKEYIVKYGDSLQSS